MSDDEYIGDYSICIIGKRKPTIKEAEEFCKNDMKQMGYKFVVAVREVDSDEAHSFFDMDNEEKYPVNNALPNKSEKKQIEKLPEPEIKEEKNTIVSIKLKNLSFFMG